MNDDKNVFIASLHSDYSRYAFFAGEFIPGNGYNGKG
jgi:hypothetical protein